LDKIILKKMQLYGFHGLLPEETKLGQRCNVTVELYVSLKEAGTSDEMDDSVNYGLVFEVVKNRVEGKPFNLIEALAERISEDLLKEFPKINSCLIQVEKPNPPVNGNYESVAVEIMRGRQE